MKGNGPVSGRYLSLEGTAGDRCGGGWRGERAVDRGAAGPGGIDGEPGGRQGQFVAGVPGALAAGATPQGPRVEPVRYPHTSALIIRTGCC